MVFKKLKEIHLKLNLGKWCVRLKNKKKLGHVMNKEGSHSNLKSLQQLKVFQSQKQWLMCKCFWVWWDNTRNPYLDMPILLGLCLS
jgi:hypothetical protein